MTEKHEQTVVRTTEELTNTFQQQEKELNKQAEERTKELTKELSTAHRVEMERIQKEEIKTRIEMKESMEEKMEEKIKLMTLENKENVARESLLCVVCLLLLVVCWLFVVVCCERGTFAHNYVLSSFLFITLCRSHKGAHTSIKYVRK